MSRVLWGLGGSVLALFLGIGGLLYWVSETSSGQGWLKATLEGLLHDPEGLTVSIGALDGSVFSDLHVKDLTLSDPRGIWLSVDEARLTWRVGALLRGRVSVESLTARAIVLDRLPEFPETPPTAPGEESGFDLSWLARVEILDINVDPIRLGAPVLGRPLSLSLKGKAAGGDEAMRFVLDLAQVVGEGSGPGFVATVDSVYSPSVPALDLKVAINDPTGGVFASLLGMPGQAGFSVQVDGQGPLSHWTSTLELEVDGFVRMDGTFKGSMTDAALSGDLDVGLVALQNAPAAMRDSIGPKARFRVNGVQPKDGPFTLGLLSFSSADWQLDAHGQVDTRGDEPVFDLSGTTALDGPSVLAMFLTGFHLDRGDLTFSAKGTPTQANVDLALNASDVRLDGIVSADTLHLKATITPSTATGTGSLPVVISAATEGFALPIAGDLVSTAIGPEPTLDALGTLDPKTLVWQVDTLKLAAREVTLGGQGAFDIANLRLAPLTAILDIPRVQNVLPQVSGRLGVEAKTDSLVLSPLGGRIDVDGSGQLESGAPDDPIWALLGPTPHLKAGVSFPENDPTEVLRIENLAFDGAGATAEGYVVIGGDWESVDARLSAMLRDPGAIGAGVTGKPVTLSFAATGALVNPAAEVTVSAPEIDALGSNIRDLSLKATTTVTTDDSGPAGQVDLSAQIGGQPVSARVPFGVGENFGTLSLGPARVQVGSARADVQAKVPLSALETATGTLGLTVPDTSVLSALGVPGLSGSLGVKVDLAGRSGSASALNATIQSGSLRFGESVLGTINGTARLTALSEQGVLDARITSTDGRVASASWRQAALTATGPLLSVGLTASLDGALRVANTDQPLSARVGAKVARMTGARQITVMPLDFQIGAHRITQSSAATIRLQDGTVALTGLNMAMDTGRLTGSGTLGAGGSAQLAFKLSDIPLNILETFLPGIGIGGHLGGTVTLGGSLDRPQGRIALGIDDLTSTASTSKRATARLDATLGTSFQARLALEGLGPTPITATASFPMGPGFSVAPNAPLKGRLQGSGDLADIWAFVPLIEHRPSGPFFVDLTAGGRLDAPTLAGSLSTTKARYENLLTGTLLTDLDLTVNADVSRTVTVSLNARDGGPGTVSAQGRFFLRDPANPTGSLTLATHGATLVRRDDVVASANTDIVAHLDEQGGSIRGNVAMQEVTVRLVNTLGASIPELKVIEIGGAGQPCTRAEALDLQEQAEVRARAAPARPIALDIAVSLPEQVRVTGRGIDSQWRGNLKITGTTAAPSIVGSIENVRGQLELVGRVFSLKDSVIRFDGGDRIDPILGIVATNESARLSATVKVTGPVSSPALTFESDPPMPEDEVVANVLFGKSSGELSAIEAVQLARALGQLKNIGTGGSGIIGTLREATGLDVLRLGESESGSATLEAGAYVRENVYVGVVQGLAPGESAVEVQVELTPNINVETQMGATGTGSAAAMWKWDY